MTPLSNMSPDDMRVAMAEVEGRSPQPGSGWLAQVLNNTVLPDYLNSLDAVASVEARLTEEQRENVVNMLETTTDNAVFATALQRTKAILLATEKALPSSSQA